VILPLNLGFQVVIIAIVVSCTTIIAFLLNRELKVHLISVSSRIDEIRKIRLLELSREIIKFFAQSETKAELEKMYSGINNETGSLDFLQLATISLFDLSNLNDNLIGVINPSIEFSKFEFRSKFLLRLIIFDGIALFSIFILILLLGVNENFSHLLILIDYINISWAIFFSVSVLWFILYVLKSDRKIIGPVNYA
jgi:hypothetical protein